MKQTAVLTLEVWAPLPGWPGYEVSTLGRARSIDREVVCKNGVVKKLRGKVLKPWVTEKGYLTYQRWNDSIPAGRAVLMAFTGQSGEGLHACHCNGNPADNRLVNLRWDTPTGNERDKLVHGTHHRGERHPAARLTNEQVAAIRADTRLHRVIAADYGVSRNHISSIKCGAFRKYG